MKPLIEFKKSLKSTVLGVCALAALGVGSAQASTVGDFTALKSLPDIAVGNLTTDYSLTYTGGELTGGELIVDGAAPDSYLVTLGGSSLGLITSGDFDFDATYSATAGTFTSASMTISGSYNDPSASAEPLLTASLASDPGALGLDDAFAFDTAPDQMAFLLDTTGGSLEGLFSSQILFIFTAIGLDDGYEKLDFSTAFSGSNGSGDVASVVPIPAAAWLFASALGLGGLVGRRTARRAATGSSSESVTS